MADEIIGLGTILRVNDQGGPGGSQQVIPSVDQLTPPATEVNFVPAPTYDMPSRVIPQVPTLEEPGTWSFRFLHKTGVDTLSRMEVLKALTHEDDCPEWEIEYPDATVDEFTAWVKKVEPDAPLDNLKTYMVTLQLNSEVERS